MRGKREGRGIYKYPNGDVYEGEWTNNVLHGYGKYTWNNEGRSTEGMWKLGKKDGQHLYISPEGKEK